MRQLEGSWQTEPKPEEEWGKVECEPIVSTEVWEQANRIIEEHIKSWKRPGPSPVHLFGGLAVCRCGAKMYVRAGSPKYVCRKCHNKIPIVDLEAVILEELKAFFGARTRVERLIDDTSRNLAEKASLLETHRQEIQSVRQEMRQTHQLYLNQQISGDGFRDLFRPAEERFKQLQAELPKLEADVAFLKVNKLSADDVVRESALLHEKWPSMQSDDRRRIVEALIEKIVIGDGEIDITYSCAPSSEELCKSQQGLRPG